MNQAQTKRNDVTLTVAEVASIMRVNRETVTAMVRSGRLRAFRFGRVYRIPATALNDLQAARA